MQVITEHGEEISADAAAAMPYADATVKEALRLQPIVPVLFRVALKSFELGGYSIPKASPFAQLTAERMSINIKFHSVGVLK